VVRALFRSCFLFDFSDLHHDKTKALRAFDPEKLNGFLRRGFEVDHLKHEESQRTPDLRIFARADRGRFIFIPGITSFAVGDEPCRDGVAAAPLGDFCNKVGTERQKSMAARMSAIGGLSGLVILNPSFSPFDPKATSPSLLIVTVYLP